MITKVDQRIKNPAHPGHNNQLISTNGRKARRIFDGEPLEENVEALLTAACMSSSKERCGFIVGDEATTQDIFYVNNIHQEPTHNFLMEAADMEAVITEIYEIRQTQIIGVFHTHPNNVTWPTPRDLLGWPNPKLGWRYWIVTANEVIEWELA
jgi:proteasome lid subunit RPN8/RPN11